MDIQTVPASFRPVGVITITTDFGHKGPFIGTMKGAMLSRYADATIVDLTHETVVHWPAEAGFWVARAYRFFPAGTVHVAVVDPGVGTQRNIIAAVHDGHMFLAPDNGLLSPLLSPGRQSTVFRLDDALLEKLSIHRPSATFHGRDIFAPVAAELAAGNIAPDELGPQVAEIVPSWLEEPVVSATGVSGVIVTVDHFGNLITNIDASLIEAFRRPSARVGNHDIPFHRTYGDSRPGDYLALVNSFDVVEIARAERSAADGLGAGRGAPVVIRESEVPQT